MVEQHRLEESPMVLKTARRAHHSSSILFCNPGFLDAILVSIMLVSAFIPLLRPQLSPIADALTNSEDVVFKARLERWSNRDIKVPGAIISPATENDVAIIVTKKACFLKFLQNSQHQNEMLLTCL
jgi:hypothetical protein